MSVIGVPGVGWVDRFIKEFLRLRFSGVLVSALDNDDASNRELKSIQKLLAKQDKIKLFRADWDVSD